MIIPWARNDARRVVLFLSARRTAIGIDVQMLVDERKQVRALPEPVKRRSLARPLRSGRECWMFVVPAAG
jgi:hypothetical protein